MSKKIPTSEERKALELDVYENLYRSKPSTRKPRIRSLLLKNSALRFETLIKQHCTNTTRVLEIGCGEGDYSIFCAKLGAQVSAIDISQAAIKKAEINAEQNELHSRVKFERMDAEKLSFKEDSFDLIIDHEALSSLDFSNAFNEILRVTKPASGI